jgi:hypothetical protein
MPQKPDCCGAQPFGLDLANQPFDEQVPANADPNTSRLRRTVAKSPGVNPSGNGSGVARVRIGRAAALQLMRHGKSGLNGASRRPSSSHTGRDSREIVRRRTDVMRSASAAFCHVRSE